MFKGNTMRTAKITRKTVETAITAEINLDGTGKHTIQTGVGFFDHMLDQLAKHSLIDISIKAKGDLHIDDHHTVEDTGLALGDALAAAIGDKTGIRRYGNCTLVMDDALIRAALDFSGRPYITWKVALPHGKIGSFDTELAREFFTALAMRAGITLHIESLDGFNTHHIVEAAFKAVARALRTAIEPDPRAKGRVPSTKGSLSS